MFGHHVYTTHGGRCGRGPGSHRERERAFGPGYGFGGFPAAPGGAEVTSAVAAGARPAAATSAPRRCLLLAEEPRNGYQIMQEVQERSDGVWSPSPGSVYPALQQLEDEGLIRSAGERRTQALRAHRRRARLPEGSRRGQGRAVGADERRRQRSGRRAGQADPGGWVCVRADHAHRKRCADGARPARCWRAPGATSTASSGRASRRAPTARAPRARTSRRPARSRQSA